MGDRAIFLDRDGTIIEDSGYIDDPDRVRLIPGAAEAIRRFREGGYRVVIISNQSGIARGLFDEDDLSAVHERLESLLREQGAELDGAYYCPYLDGPEAKVEAYRRDSELRKPKPGMLLQAAREMDIDLSASWMIGDALTDVQAGRAAGCRTILIARDRAKSDDDRVPSDALVVESLRAAADVVLSESDASTSAVARSAVSTGETRPLAPNATSANDAVVRLLEDIHGQIDRALRARRQHDFSVLRLFGALLQMFAIVSGVWGAVALLNDMNEAAVGRLLLACFFQLASLSAFAVDRFR